MHAEHFIDQLRVLAALDDNPPTNRTLQAFRTVAREDFAGRGPWKLRSALADVTLPPRLTPDADATIVARSAAERRTFFLPTPPPPT